MYEKDIIQEDSITLTTTTLSCSCIMSFNLMLWEAMSEVHVHQDEQETTKKAPYLLTNPFTFTFHLPKVLLMHLFR